MKVIYTDFKYSSPLVPLKINNVEFIFLHHIGANEGIPEEIHDWHLKQGWNGIGYNEYIRKDGTIHICRGDNIGAHTYAYNSRGYGIALEGDYDKEEKVPAIQLAALINRLRYNIDRFPKKIEVLPHSEKVPTSCPGRHFPLNEVLKAITEQIIDVNEALKLMESVGIVNTPEYWQKAKDVVRFQEQLYLNIANYINRKE